jgi:hypothetical protein
MADIIMIGEIRDRATAQIAIQASLTGPPQAVVPSLSEQIDAAPAEMVVRRRKRRPFRKTVDARSVPRMTDNIHHDIGNPVTPAPARHLCRVRRQRRLQDHPCAIEALLRRNPEAGMVDIFQYHELEDSRSDSHQA